MMFGIVFFGLVSKISALALLLMHSDHLQFGLYFEIKLLDRIWFGKNINPFISASVHRDRNKTTHVLVS